MRAADIKKSVIGRFGTARGVLDLCVFPLMLASYVGLIYLANGSALRPDEFPLIVAPAITFTLTFGNCVAQVLRLKGSNCEKYNNIVVLNFLVVVAQFCLCLAIALFHRPIVEMSVVLTVFIVYWVWDECMMLWLRGVTEQQANVTEIENGHRLVNVPSCIGLVIVLLILTLHWFLPFQHRIEEIMNEALGSSKDAHAALMRSKDLLIGFEVEVFVIGLVSFHLFVAAVSYLFATVPESNPVPTSNGGATGGPAGA